MVLPQNIDKINSITVSLNENDSLELQSLRFIELSSLSDRNYWNGGFGRERLRAWTGRLMAQSVGKSYTINGSGSITFNANQSYDTRRLQTYARGSGPEVDNSGAGVGVSIQFADTLGAGIESLLAKNGILSYDKKKTAFIASDTMKSQAGTNALLAYFNLSPFYRECLTLELSYTDALGAVRKVQIPFMTTYLSYLLKENGGDLSGGNGDFKTWISGVLQQNENAALPLRLAQYASLDGVKLVYGSSPEGFTSSNSGVINATSDTICVENLCFYEGVTGSNFNSRYSTKYLSPMLETSLTPAYHYAAAGQGRTLSQGSTLSASRTAGTLERGAPPARSLENKYLVKIKTADIETAGTTDPVTVSLTYTNTAGQQMTTTAYSLPAQAGSFYGTNYRGAASDLQYERHMRRNCLCEFVVELADVSTVDAVTLSINGTNEWQVEYVTVYRLTALEQRWGERSDSGAGTSHLYWRREYQGTQVAHVRQSALLYSAKNTKTLSFTTYDETGAATPPSQETKTDSYLTSLPNAMTYDDTRKNLGLAIPKYTYQVDVKVADVQDAGSGNYFYFQLVFENGSSGVVLANQQLSSDSFRQGMTESFQIKTTQNYGNIQAIRIICDRTASSSNVFDKLNIENISVTLGNNSGISKSWVVDRVGWIDILYVDEGSDYGVDGLDTVSDASTANVEVVKEFPISRTATAVDLLFCLTTGKDSASDPSDPFQNALKGRFEATLIYRDSDGAEQSKNFDLTSAIQSYNDTDKTFWLYRPNHVDRFTLSLTDISSVTALILTRTDGDQSWVVDSVSIQQIGGLGEVYLSPVLTEYMRDPTAANDLAQSTNGAVISGNGNAAITFTENAIDVVSGQDSESWSASISRVPALSSETLNVYLFSGSVIGRAYTFTADSPAIRATAKYTTIYGGNPVQNSFQLSSLGTIDGQAVLYGKGLSVSAMSSLNSLTLSSTSVSTSNQPVISHAVVERARGNVIVGTYYFDFANIDLGVSNPEAGVSTAKAGTADMNQTLSLRLSADQLVQLTPETSDVAVAIRYTSALDPEDSPRIYQSPYFYLTDFDLTTLTGGQELQLPFNIDGIGSLQGLSVVSSGPNVRFDSAVIYNYAGGPETNSGATRLGICSILEPFTSSTMDSVLSGAYGNLVPVTFTFTTPSDAQLPVIGAGTSKTVQMTVTYVDGEGQKRTEFVEDLISRLPNAASSIPAGSETTLTLLLDDVSYVSSLTINPVQDPWFLTRVSASVDRPDGTAAIGSTAVNNWLGYGLKMDVRPEEYREDGEDVSDNRLLSFTVTGQGTQAGIPASASNGATLLVTAYAGDTVTLTPSMTVDGAPAREFVWSMGEWAEYLHTSSQDLRYARGQGTFSVPSGARAGDSYSFSVIPHADMSLAVPVTIVVADPPPAPERTDDAGFDAGTEEGAADGAGE